MIAHASPALMVVLSLSGGFHGNLHAVLEFFENSPSSTARPTAANQTSRCWRPRSGFIIAGWRNRIWCLWTGSFSCRRSTRERTGTRARGPETVLVRQPSDHGRIDSASRVGLPSVRFDELLEFRHA